MFFYKVWRWIKGIIAILVFLLLIMFVFGKTYNFVNPSFYTDKMTKYYVKNNFVDIYRDGMFKVTVIAKPKYTDYGLPIVYEKILQKYKKQNGIKCLCYDKVYIDRIKYDFELFPRKEKKEYRLVGFSILNKEGLALYETKEENEMPSLDIKVSNLEPDCRLINMLPKLYKKVRSLMIHKSYVMYDKERDGPIDFGSTEQTG